ncbi:hypothetical protein [Asanoa siamensis]|uniref:Uridine kinase n=1 Tax=Asanoa siamensis TaxID=926357 RepID=A0ABQ4D4B7_9ACTN|nr:hypothetical protein [Asanoa siamensis]GIF78369.1 hypothetical protein Asi02nite_78870 [Asanoa siamensis]
MAVDGCSAAGKRAVAVRTRFPRDSPESYYLDSWDNDGIRDELLLPLGPGGSRRYRAALMDFAALERSDEPAWKATDDAVLVADGCFLQRPELDPHWDLRIFVDIPLDEVLRRGIARDQAWMESAAEAERRYRTKYIPGESRYLDEVRPRGRAELVVDNRDFADPRLTDQRVDRSA